MLRSAWRDYVAYFEHSFPGKLSAPESDETAVGDGVALRQEFGAQWKPGDQHELTRRAAHAASTARAGAQAARPVMRELYETRASAYRDGVREFVLGYREAFRDTLLQARGCVPVARTACLLTRQRRKRRACNKRRAGARTCRGNTAW